MVEPVEEEPDEAPGHAAVLPGPLEQVAQSPRGEQQKLYELRHVQRLWPHTQTQQACCTFRLRPPSTRSTHGVKP